jgi:hypothetical protein
MNALSERTIVGRRRDNRLELNIRNAEILIVEDVQTFPLFLELGQVIYDVVIVSGTLTEKTTLNCDSDLIVSSFVDGLKTPPDVISSVEAADMDHLVLGDGIGDQDLGVDIVAIPRCHSFRINRFWIRTRDCAVYIRGDTTECENTFTPDDPIGFVKWISDFGDVGTVPGKFSDNRGFSSTRRRCRSRRSCHRTIGWVGAHNLLAVCADCETKVSFIIVFLWPFILLHHFTTYARTTISINTYSDNIPPFLYFFISTLFSLDILSLVLEKSKDSYPVDLHRISDVICAWLRHHEILSFLALASDPSAL